MSTVQRARDRGARQGRRILQLLADEFHGKRLSTGLSQEAVATASGLSRPIYSRIETAKRVTTSFDEASRIAAVLGLDVVVRLYPGGEPLRDTAQQGRLDQLMRAVKAPLTWRPEVPLPVSADRPEWRAWDAVIWGSGERTAVEVEMSIRDGQALERRLALKRRDDPTEGFLLVIADTRANRSVLGDHPALFADLPRLSRRTVLVELRAGRHPPTGLVFL